MPLKFAKLTRSAMQALPPGASVMENGIRYQKLPNGDARFSVDLQVDGRKIHKVVGKESEGVTRSHCEAYIEKLRTEARERRLGLPKGRKVAMLFREAAEGYLERLRNTVSPGQVREKQYRLRKHLIPFFGNQPLDQIDDYTIERYKYTRKSTGCSEATINRELTLLGHLLRKAAGWGWATKREIKIVKFRETSRRIVYLTPDQADRLLTAAQNSSNPQLYAAVLIALDTGMRKSEILAIRGEHLDLENRVLYIPKAKAGARVQPMTARLASYLAKNAPAEGWLFPSTGAVKARSGHTECLQHAFAAVVREAGLGPGIGMHTLRHTAITHMVQAGVDLPTVKAFSGHSNIQMVERYSHANKQHLMAALDRLEGRYTNGRDHR